MTRGYLVTPVGDIDFGKSSELKKLEQALIYVHESDLNEFILYKDLSKALFEESVK